MNQGDIYLANFNPAKGHEQAGFRPVLIMQNNFLNKNLGTAIVAPITSTISQGGLLTTFYIPKQAAGLDKDSVVLLFQLRTLDKGRLEKKIGNLSSDQMSKVKAQLKFVF